MFSPISSSQPVSAGSRKSFYRQFCLAIFLFIFAIESLAQTKPVPRRPAPAPARPAPAPRPVPEASYILSRVLSNGLEIVVYEDHTVPLVTVEYSNRAGSSVESPAESGLSHFMEHLFFKSNQAMVDKEPYLQHIGQMGISYNGTTVEEQCNEYLTTLTSNLNPALHFLRDAAEHPLFLPADVDSERLIVLHEFDDKDSNPYINLSREMTQRLYYKYPNRKNPIGSRDVVQHATPEQIKAFRTKYWAPNNSVVVITGDVKPEDAFAQVTQLFGDWPRGTEPIAGADAVVHPPLPQSSGTVLEGAVQNVFFEIGWQGPSVSKDATATYAADVFSFILRQSGSRFQRALTDTGLATNVDLGYYTQRNVGAISLVMSTSPEKARAAIKAAQNEVAHFNDPAYFSDAELQNAKTLLSADELFSREKPSEYAHVLSFWWASTGTDYFKHYHTNLAAVTRADVARYLETYVMGKPHVSIVLLSHENQQKVRLTSSEVVGQ